MTQQRTPSELGQVSDLVNQIFDEFMSRMQAVSMTPPDALDLAMNMARVAILECAGQSGTSLEHVQKAIIPDLTARLTYHVEASWAGPSERSVN